jgi:hypothetical protein
VLAYIIPPDLTVDGTTFITPDDAPLQMGLLSYEPGQKGEPHWHPDRELGTPTHQEAIIIMSGSVDIDIYDTDETHVETVTVDEGGAAFFAAGGRGWTASEDTKIIELNLGPYLGLGEDKVQINDD